MVESLKYLEYFTDESPRELASLGDNHYSVYVHVAPEEAHRYCYVGITGQLPKFRWKHGSGYKGQDKFYNAIKKFGWDNFEHKIVATGLNLDDALLFESILVCELDSINRGFNVSPGGDGHIDLLWGLNDQYSSDKASFTPVDCYTIDFEFVASYRSISSAASAVGCLASHICSCLSKDRIQSGGYRWVHHGEDPRDNPREYAAVGDPVVAYTVDGIKVAEYTSMCEAGRQTGLSHTSICAALNGRARTAGGYVWRRADQDFEVRETRYPTKCVSQYTLDGQYVATYTSLSEAAIATGVARRGIAFVCEGGAHQTKGIRFQYGDDTAPLAPIPPAIKSHTKKRPVICLTDGVVYDSCTSAGAAYGYTKHAIYRACATGRMTGKNLRFQYLDDYNTQAQTTIGS